MISNNNNNNNNNHNNNNSNNNNNPPCGIKIQGWHKDGDSYASWSGWDL